MEALYLHLHTALLNLNLEEENHYLNWIICYVNVLNSIENVIKFLGKKKINI